MIRWGIFWRMLRFNQAEIELIVRVCCKLLNICVDAFGTSMSSVDLSVYDKEWVRGNDEGADATVIWSDGTGANSVRGQRNDLVHNTRAQITAHLASLGHSRPRHSKDRALLERIRDVAPK